MTFSTHRRTPLDELPCIRFHDLRDTCATLLLTNDVLAKIVPEMLGRSSTAITLEGTGTSYRGWETW